MTRFLRIPEVLERTGLSRTRLYAEIEAGRFPKPVKITAGSRAVAFAESRAGRMGSRETG